MKFQILIIKIEIINLRAFKPLRKAENYSAYPIIYIAHEGELLLLVLPNSGTGRKIQVDSYVL